MTYFKLFVATLCTAMFLTTGAYSQSSGSQGKFVIHNQSDKNIVSGFYTNDGSGWSDNWLAEQLRPNEQANAAFNAETGSCAQTLQVGWLGSNGGEVMDDPINIDICQASNVYLADNEIYYD